MRKQYCTVICNVLKYIIDYHENYIAHTIIVRNQIRNKAHFRTTNLIYGRFRNILINFPMNRCNIEMWFNSDK